MLARGDLLRVFPKALPGYLDALENGAEAMAAAGLDDMLALCMFLARAGAETGGLTIVEESGNYSAERMRAVWPNRFTEAEALVYARKPQAILNRAYARAELGNRGEWSGDGWKYRGRNILQTTGRANYREMGKRLGVDLEADPDKLSNDFDLGLRAALLEWTDQKLSGIVADLGPTHAAVLKVARGINAGNVNSSITPNGLGVQKQFFAKLWGRFGQGAYAELNPAADGILEDGEKGPAVLELQEELARLGYAVGKPDGVFGPRTQAAVAALQAREGWGGEPGKYLIEWRPMMADATPFADEERKALTSRDLARAGNKPVAILRRAKMAAGSAVSFLGFGKVAEESGTLPGLFESVQTALEPLITATSWLFSSKLALAIGGATLAYFGLSWLINQFVKERQTFGGVTEAGTE